MTLRWKENLSSSGQLTAPHSKAIIFFQLMIEKTQNKAPWESLSKGFHQLRIGSADGGFEAFIWKGEAGQTVLMNGATHGDEYEGPTMLTNLASDWRPKNLRGTVVAIPVLSEPAFFAGRRCHPQDGANLARVFPGSPVGSPCEKLADLFLDSVLKYADYYLDYHSGGVTYELLPWVGYMCTEDAGVEETQGRMAACFDKYWCWGSPYIGGRTLSAAFDLGIPAIYTESQGCGGVRGDDLSAIHNGLFNFLRSFDFIPEPSPILDNPAKYISNDAEEAHLQMHHPSPLQGIFIPDVSNGDVLVKGDKLGTVHSLSGDSSVPVYAERAGTLVCLRRQRSVTPGEALATVVPIED